MVVEYPDMSSLAANATVADFVALPNSSYPYFWALIMAGLWIIFTFSMYFREVELLGKGKMLSSMAVSSLSIIILSVIGSLFGIISSNILIYIITLGIVFIAIWIFSGDR